MTRRTRSSSSAYFFTHGTVVSPRESQTTRISHGTSTASAMRANAPMIASSSSFAVTTTETRGFIP